MPTLTKRPTRTKISTSKGFRSGLEERLAQDLIDAGVGFTYEDQVIEYTKPEKIARYTPDFTLENGIIIEAKGRFLTADRQKHLLIKKQKPALDIRFVFSNSKQRISKKSRTTYADWCTKHGFLFADECVPVPWIKEKKKNVRH